MKALFFGVSLPCTAHALFFLYVALSFEQKYLSVQKLQLILDSLIKRNRTYLYVYIGYRCLMLKEALFLWVEQMYIKEQILSRYRETARVQEDKPKDRSTERVLEKLNSINNAEEIAEEKLEYVRKCIIYTARFTCLMLGMGYKTRLTVAVHTGMFLVADFGVMLLSRHLFLLYRQHRISYQNGTELALLHKEHLGAEQATKKHREASEQFRRETQTYVQLSFFLNLTRSVFFAGFIACEQAYLLKYGTREEAVYFSSISKKLEKIVNCIIKIF
ncbi:hypothetical protein NECID01_0037 [Nematocida sp. AWRm77]|nr:hypothetical protein NECID01_0037 [Nematocida sp. AWRm77]